MFCMVALIPDAAPRVSAGTELMMSDMFGEANMPAPIPWRKIASASER
jgi:hypothetical protein